LPTENKQWLAPRRALYKALVSLLHHLIHPLSDLPLHYFYLSLLSLIHNMPSFLGAAALAGLLSTVIAAPTAPPTNVKITVSQVPNGKVFVNGALSVNSTFSKFGVAPPSNVLNAAAAAQSGSVKASPEQYDESYLCPVTLGSNTLMLDFDTGSADLWAFSNETPQKQAQGHSLYNTATGTKLQGYTWKIVYGDGSGAKGNVFADKVVVGGVTATRQAVEAATSVSKTFSQDKQNDGLLGLAFSSINTVKPQKQTTFFDTVKPTLAQKLFTADLKHGQPGQYTFG
jgi:aspergillopepsin I